MPSSSLYRTITVTMEFWLAIPLAQKMYVLKYPYNLILTYGISDVGLYMCQAVICFHLCRGGRGEERRNIIKSYRNILPNFCIAKTK